jgi:transcriptional regulator with XRE-family HTH domain
MVLHKTSPISPGPEEDGLERAPAFAELWQRTELKRAVATLLVRARKRASLTQEELANRLGLGQPQVSRMESATGSVPELPTIVRYLAACQCDFAIATGKFNDTRTLLDARSAAFFRSGSEVVVNMALDRVRTMQQYFASRSAALFRGLARRGRVAATGSETTTESSTAQGHEPSMTESDQDKRYLPQSAPGKGRKHRQDLSSS